jgi:preprotein translocase subunit SecA
MALPTLLRPALAAAGRLAAAPWVENTDIRQNAFDRWLLDLCGRWTVWTSPLRRWRLQRFARRVMALARPLAALAEPELQRAATEVAAALRRQGLQPALVAQSFALIREVSGRCLGKRHFPVQLMGGRSMLDGEIVEMHTGEGKTLTALLPAVTMALAGVPVHVITVNEYLAERDADNLMPVYAYFGLDVGKVLPGQQPPERAAAYRCDVTYCVNKDLTFDYLRDRIEALAGRLGPRAQVLALARTGAAPADARQAVAAVMRGLWFAIVDEADSVFIDEARTPLIISRSSRAIGEAGACDAALALAGVLAEGPHFLLRLRERAAMLTEGGRLALAAVDDTRLPASVIERERLIEQALTAIHGYQRDRHYIVVDDQVQIVDEYTGRVMPDRSWEGGLHQLIERKEALETSAGRDTIARITYQRMFRRYLRVAGMSGTVTEVAGELMAVLGTAVTCIPTHRPVRRRKLGVVVFCASADRDAAVVAAARRETTLGRPVLVGTRSVAASERIAALCAAAGLAHKVLNARQDADEAATIAEAGEAGRITVATNMAGRGTDILLNDAVRAAGGLHVILTEFHDSPRIDRQLAGRAGRQGDPGSFECLVALDDELFVAHAPRLGAALRRHAQRRRQDRVARLPALLLRHWAQRAAERHNAELRRHTLAQEQQTDRLLAFAGRPE